MDDFNARVLLAKFCSPADESIGQHLAEYGAVETMAKIAKRNQLSDAELKIEFEQILQNTKIAQSQIIVPGSQLWPAKLNDLDSIAPYCLWHKGELSNLSIEQPVIAIVGARATTYQFEQSTTQISTDLASQKAIIVSGAAYGIDAAAHRGALSVSGKTIAVLAGGIDVVYPSGHAGLLSRITQSGGLLCECPPGSKPLKQHFLTRNRIIAALSDQVVVMHAAQRSGSLSTANWAAALGRPVWGFNNFGHDQKSLGVNQAIGEGWMLPLTKTSQLLSDLAKQ